LQYKGTQKTIPEIGKELNVNYLIEGSAQRFEDQVRIRVQLINAVTDDHIWGDTYEGNWKDIMSFQSEIAKQIAGELKTVLTPEEKEQIEKSQTTNSEAYNLYLQGRFYWNKRTKDGLNKSVEYFENAIKTDPNYALAYAGLADAYYILTWYGWYNRPEGLIKSREYALQALKIDNNLAEAHAIVGTLLCWNNWEWEKAKKELLLAVELNPNYAIAHSYYSELLDILKQNSEARQHINLALKLDPFFQMLHGLSSLYYYHEGKFEESLEECQVMRKLDPGFTAVNYRFFNIYMMRGEDFNALEALQTIMLSDSLLAKNVYLIKNVYNQSGINGLLKWLIELELDKPNPPSVAIARWYVKLDMKDKTLNWLEKAFEEHQPEIPRINNDPDFDNIRSEPRFQAIIRKMGLSEYQNLK
jgi:tetratricopeptide (TPR) repeat protein